MLEMPVGMVSGEAVLVPFLESEESLSIEELSTRVERGFLGGGNLGLEERDGVETILRLRLRPATGRELSLVLVDRGSRGIELNFYALPKSLTPYVREMWAFQNRVGPCPEYAPCWESVHFGGWLAMETRCKLSELALYDLRTPQPSQLFGGNEPFFETLLDFKSTSRSNIINFSSSHVRLDPMSRHFEVIEWFVESACRLLHTEASKTCLINFQEQFLVPPMVEA